MSYIQKKKKKEIKVKRFREIKLGNYSFFIFLYCITIIIQIFRHVSPGSPRYTDTTGQIIIEDFSGEVYKTTL